MARNSRMSLEDRISSTLNAPKRGEEQDEIIVYFKRSRYTDYPRQSVQLAEQYMREEVGLNFRIEIIDKIPYDSLDHLTQFAVTEYDNNTRKKFFREEIKKLYEGKQSDFFPLTRSSRRALVEINETCSDYMKRKVTKGLEYFMGGFANTLYGISLTKRAEVVLFNKGLVRRKLYKGREEQREENYELYRTKLKARRTRLIKESTNTLLHELGHMAGLWHTFQYENDRLVDYYQGTPDLMSYQKSGRGKYGFTLTPKQKDQMRDYFSGGQSYKDMQRHKFYLLTHLAEIKQRMGFREPGDEVAFKSLLMEAGEKDD